MLCFCAGHGLLSLIFAVIGCREAARWAAHLGAAATAAAAGALAPAVDTAAGTPDGAAITGLVQAEQLFRHRSSPHAAPGRGCKSDPHELGGGV